MIKKNIHNELSFVIGERDAQQNQKRTDAIRRGVYVFINIAAGSHHHHRHRLRRGTSE